VAYYVAQYDAEIRYMDEQIGRVLAELELLGLRSRTLLAFSADHGESLGEHDYWFEHGRLPYDDSVRVPLILAGPGLEAGHVVDSPVELRALLPTLLDLAGLPPLAESDAASLRPLLAGEEAPAAVAFSESGYATFQRAIRTARWKLIHVPDPGDRAIMQGTPFELYDLAADPGEERNLVAAEPDRVAALRGPLEAWMAAVGSGPPAGAAPPVAAAPPEPATREALRSLGYLD
jgi:arylsulfatase A-like enzyme